MKKSSLKGSLLLLIGAVIWGAAFAAQRSGMDYMGPFSFSGIRMLLGALVLLPFSLRSGKKADPKLQRKAGLLCGLFLFCAISLQQVGLITTQAGKAGFITALYVVLVPLASLMLFRKRQGVLLWIGIGFAVAALWLLCVPKEGLRIEKGDLMMLGCAMCFTGQILCVDRYGPCVDGVTLARDEFLVTGLLSLIIALFTEQITGEGIRGALIPILYTGILSCGVGYTLQILGQKSVDPTLASLLMCLESVFAVLTGVLLLGESMTLREGIGFVLMFSAVILAQLSPHTAKKEQ